MSRVVNGYVGVAGGMAVEIVSSFHATWERAANFIPA